MGQKEVQSVENFSIVCLADNRDVMAGMALSPSLLHLLYRKIVKYFKLRSAKHCPALLCETSREIRDISESSEGKLQMEAEAVAEIPVIRI